MSKKHDKPLKVAIVGKAPSSRLLAPFDDPAWEIWGLSDAATYCSRWDRWFELHELQKYKDTYPEYYEWLTREHGKPIYVDGTQPLSRELPCAVPYPLEATLKRFRRYFSNSVSYMVALAIREGAKSIAIYGVDMAQNSEYFGQRPSVEYFLGLAEGMGIEIILPDECQLLKLAALYAFDTTNTDYANKSRTRDSELADRQSELAGKRDEFAVRQKQLEGARVELGVLAQANGQLDANEEKLRAYLAIRAQTLEKEIAATAARFREADLGWHVLHGAREDLDWHKQWGLHGAQS